MLGQLLRQQSGAAAAEMAMVAPLLIVLMFGSMELGHYFYSQHIVVKAVRDGARYAGRQGFSNYTCPNSVSTTVRDDTRRVTRTNTVDGTGTPRLADWTNDASVSVTVRCDTSGSYGSFYDGLTGIPVVTVSATVPYTSLFSAIGFNSVALQMSASSEAAVMGV